jgi:hypothetical protein
VLEVAFFLQAAQDSAYGGFLQRPAGLFQPLPDLIGTLNPVPPDQFKNGSLKFAQFGGIMGGRFVTHCSVTCHNVTHCSTGPDCRAILHSGIEKRRATHRERPHSRGDNPVSAHPASRQHAEKIEG